MNPGSGARRFASRVRRGDSMQRRSTAGGPKVSMRRESIFSTRFRKAARFDGFMSISGSLADSACTDIRGPNHARPCGCGGRAQNAFCSLRDQPHARSWTEPRCGKLRIASAWIPCERMPIRSGCGLPFRKAVEPLAPYCSTKASWQVSGMFFGPSFSSYREFGPRCLSTLFRGTPSIVCGATVSGCCTRASGRIVSLCSTKTKKRHPKEAAVSRAKREFSSTHAHNVAVAKVRLSPFPVQVGRSTLARRASDWGRAQGDVSRAGQFETQGPVRGLSRARHGNVSSCFIRTSPFRLPSNVTETLWPPLSSTEKTPYW